MYGAPISHWYTYITEENESSYLPAFQKTLAYRYDVLVELRSLRSGRDMLRMMRDFYTFTVGRLQKRRPLLKDPFAVFAIEWFAKRLNCRVVITVRHPAAFASSLKRAELTRTHSIRLNSRASLQNWKKRLTQEEIARICTLTADTWPLYYPEDEW